MNKYESNVKLHVKQVKHIVKRRMLYIFGRMDESDSIGFKYGLEKSGMVEKYMVKKVHYGVLTSPATKRVACSQAT